MGTEGGETGTATAHRAKLPTLVIAAPKGLVRPVELEEADKTFPTFFQGQAQGSIDTER